MTITEAFKKFDAKLKNSRWAYSAISEDGCVVIAGWYRKLKKTWPTYEDNLSKWQGDSNGKRLFAEHLIKANNENLPIKLVIVYSDQDNNTVLDEYDAELNRGTNDFSARKDVVGKVVEFNGDHFIIEFYAV